MNIWIITIKLLGNIFFFNLAQKLVLTMCVYIPIGFSHKYLYPNGIC